MSTSGYVKDGLKKVFSKPSYLLLAIISAITAFTITTWLPNWMLASNGLFSESLPISEKLSLIFALWASITTNYTPLAAVSVALGTILFGITLSLAVFVIHRRSARNRGIGAGIIGVFAGALGLGCAACGSAIALSTVLAVFGLSSLIPSFPFHGAEMGILGVILQLIAIRLLAKDAVSPIVCPS